MAGRSVYWLDCNGCGEPIHTARAGPQWVLGPLGYSVVRVHDDPECLRRACEARDGKPVDAPKAKQSVLGDV